MKAKDALLERWENVLAEKGDAPAIFNTRGEVVRTFQQIDDQSRVFETKLDGLGWRATIGVQLGNHPDWPAIFIASLRREVIVLPIEQSLTDRQRDAALEHCNADGVISTGLGRGGSPEPPAVMRQMQTLAIEVNRPYLSASLLKLTSGTTGAPRAILFRSEQLLADCDQICETMGISDADLNFGVIPVSHSYGFSNLLTPLIARGVAIVLSRDRTPRAVLDHLAATNATVFPGMPIFYQAFCEMEKVPALPKLRLSVSAGAPLPLSVAKKFRERFGLSIHSFYGASECGGICYDCEAKLEIEGYVGTPMKNVDLEFVDSSADSSQIRVRSGAVGDGYFLEADEEKLGGGIFVPDDLLVREGDGFKIVGRVSDVINVAGKKVNPAEIEEVLLRFAGVRQAVAFGRESALRNEEVAACVVADRDLREKDLLEFCGKQLSGWQVPKRIFIVDSIPASERGKISRRELAKQFST